MRFTHVSASLFLASLGFDPLMSLLGGLLPDVDTICCHRKLLHNVWVPLALFLWSGSLALFVSYLFHLLLDSLTPSGVNWFWPLEIRKIRGPVRTGGLLDYIFAFLFLAFTAIDVVFRALHL